MNERIKALLVQCQTESIDGPEYPQWTDLEKFAELIVQECAEVAHCNFHVSGISLGVILKEHFGVEQ